MNSMTRVHRDNIIEKVTDNGLGEMTETSVFIDCEEDLRSVFKLWREGNLPDDGFRDFSNLVESIRSYPDEKDVIFPYKASCQVDRWFKELGLYWYEELEDGSLLSMEIIYFSNDWHCSKSWYVCVSKMSSDDPLCGTISELTITNERLTGNSIRVALDAYAGLYHQSFKKSSPFSQLVRK